MVPTQRPNILSPGARSRDAFLSRARGATGLFNVQLALALRPDFTKKDKGIQAM